MIGYELSGYGYIEVKGEDHRAFLQNLLTQDMKLLGQGSYVWSALLTPKSKLIAWCKVVSISGGVQLWMPKDLMTEVHDALNRYIITEDVTLDRQDQAWQVYLSETPNQTASVSAMVVSTDFLQPMWWVGGAQPCIDFEPMTEEAFTVLRAQSGYPLWKKDFEDPLPLEVPFMHRGVSFTKGCYVGQETIARLHGRGMNVGKSLIRFKAKQQILAGQALSPQVDATLAWVTSSGMQEDHCYGLAWLKRKTFDQDWSALGIELLDKPIAVT